ncbi:hypothetical protein C3B51_17905 [Pseudoalteromonas rubra]|uniref:Uncharacterized protein n=1 Tax=Pseudoalteromonas rubra TaxID=43658 RepID=A0A4Q7E3F6_9GAMM|nr:hypothetical protein [Pseudoalteromonas rubra]RZM76440.1 hypothetical protein C3B51_17905 [Pseudoalteromonas rubra]
MFKYSFKYILLLIVTVVFFTKLELRYSFGDYKEYLILLFNISSMVFTLMGIWIAFLYPNALKRLVNPKVIENADFSETLNETKRLESIVGSVLKSALVVVGILFIFFFKVVLSSFDFYLEYLVFWKILALSLAVVMTFMQLESVFHVIKSNIMFINDLHRKREEKEADHDI